MGKMIFVNLPVTDLDKAKAFYAALGFTNEPKFTDATAGCMVWSESIFVMLLTHPKWQTFTNRPIPGAGASEVMLAITCVSKDAVNAMADAVSAHGGQADVNSAQDHKFMMSRMFADPDGHVWEPFWMDPAMAQGDGPIAAEAVQQRAL